MKPSLYICSILIVSCFANQMIQTDWIQGDNVAGPLTLWGSSFDSYLDISWMAIPGQLALSSETIASPVLHYIDTAMSGPYTLDADDINGDGYMDVIVGGYHQDECCVWYGDGADNWSKDIISSVVDGPCGCDIADIDDDGDLDVLCTTYGGGKVYLFISSGGSSPQWTEEIVSSAFAGGHDVEAWDMDGDGDMDILAAAALDDKVVWWRNDGGSPIQWDEQEIASHVNYPCRIQAADLDLDGCIDVVASLWEGCKVIAWFGSGGSNPDWTEQTVSSYVLGAHSVRCSDVDSDGDPDLIVSSMNGNYLALFRNNGGSPIQWAKEDIDSFVSCAYARPGDMDGDGDQDIVTSSFAAAGARWYENNGDGTIWTQHEILSDYGSLSCAIPADMDGDGDLDVLLTAYAQDLVFWCEITSFKASGWLISSILDTVNSPQWASIDWDLYSPPNTEFSVSYRTSDDPVSMGSWSSPVEYPAQLNGLLDRYFQYRISMSTADPSVSPVLYSFQFNWDPDGISVEESCHGSCMTLTGGSPASGNILIRLTGTEICCTEIGVYDCAGRKLWAENITLQEGSDEYMQVPCLPSGIYNILLKVDNEFQESMPVVVLD